MKNGLILLLVALLLLTMAAHDGGARAEIEDTTAKVQRVALSGSDADSPPLPLCEPIVPTVDEPAIGDAGGTEEIA